MTWEPVEAVSRSWAVIAVLTAALWTTWSAVHARRAGRARGRFVMRAGAGQPRRVRIRGTGRTAAGARRWVGPAAAVTAGWVLFGGAAGCAVGAAGAYGLWRWRRRPRPPAADAEAAGRLPLAAELLAACLSAGAGPREAAEAVGRSMGGPVGERLGRTAAELALGGDPREAWGRLGDVPGARPLARCLERAAASGAPAAAPVSRLAAGLRADRARAATARAQRAQVLITAPVGLCFLPAFLAVGVAPVVIGLAGRLL
ncbi:type II secretion system F family protein [Streptomyces sudanensis]|uniref:type II secretion system F family protein n=1 Tax=Streptomyces sudanensis TaxID=436397 RepID=UPI0020CD372B|nr:type II secretion system F family protein [Streptomyces sudanensis]MCP9957987.1 type II secretion system F family protein [Streptomyces sudanensis]MCP9987108.1 type II secretion system F family protein [Streptomyces sudanensis]MCQ0001487.1 type II secretion system F family protein [Streptomyces sudanensis]